MSLAHQSLATINSPEFINLQKLDINPLMSSCQIKVFYLGENRNGSYISKQVASQMAKTLRGAPIVGYYKEEKQDFADHGNQVILDGDGIHFNTLTKPYGFVSPDAKVWFQDFEDSDDFGNKIKRTYLMTTGFLWTGQFEEAKQVFDDEGKPQSMELNEESVKGHWSNNIKENMDFFIINDAIISKLCILGDDVEPCFEGSAVTAPGISASFTIDDNFKKSLFEMMKELQYALEGGNTVANIEKKESVIEEKEIVTDFTEKEEPTNEQTSFEKKEEEEKEKEQDNKEDNNNNDDNEEDNNEDDKKDKEKDQKYSLLKEEYDTLKANFSSLESEIKELREFKINIENKQKDDLINQFYMLSEEDKKEVIENKTKYTLDEIKSKLAVICFEKKVNFNLDESSKNDNTMNETNKNNSTYTLNVDNTEDSTDAWVKAVEETMKEY